MEIFMDGMDAILPSQPPAEAGCMCDKIYPNPMAGE
jgi:hypothetical protein